MMMKFALRLALMLALCQCSSFAQEQPHSAEGNGAFQVSEDSAEQLISIILNLSDSQKEQLHAIFNAAIKTAAPIAAQMSAHRNSLFEAVKAGKTTEQIKDLAEQQGSLTSQMLVLQAQTFIELLGILNNDQKSQADNFVYGNIQSLLPASPQ